MFLPLLLAVLISQSTTTPVDLKSCQVTTWQTSLPTVYNALPTTFESRVVNVRYVNDQSKAISRIQFTLDDGTKVTDVGTFSPGVTIDHSFGIGYAKARSCRVTAVQFTDGTSWQQSQETS
jgi:hypothetical protein